MADRVGGDGGGLQDAGQEATVRHRDALDGTGSADDPEFARATAERNAVGVFLALDRAIRGAENRQLLDIRWKSRP